jgi:hypothetical protein
MWQSFISIFITGFSIGAIVEFALRKIVDRAIDGWFQKRKRKRKLMDKRLYIIYSKLKQDILGLTIVVPGNKIPLSSRLVLAIKHGLRREFKKSYWFLAAKYKQGIGTDIYELENFSTGFDLDGIRNHVKKHRKYADAELIKRLDAAVRAQNEWSTMKL